MNDIPSSHVDTEWSILDALIKHANLKVINRNDRSQMFDDLLSFVKQHPKTINVF